MTAPNTLDALLTTFEDALLDATVHVVLVTGTQAGGGGFWAFVRMTARNRQRFEAEREEGGDLGDYGDILASGSGTRPPRRTVDSMRRRYGFRG
ncbi:MAG: hypothetical protein AAFU79_05060 [Myxococcota bacterium]